MMAFQVNELQTFGRPYRSSGLPMQEAPATGLTGVAQALTTLKDQDPLFSKAFHKKQWDRGEVVATADELSEKMYVLMSGRINMVCTNNEGRRLVITTLESGAIFGDGALANRQDPNVFAEAAEPSLVWTVPAGKARLVAEQFPILSWGLLQTYGERLLQVENSLEDVAYKKLPERLAMLLLELSDEDGLIVGVSHQSLADHLGTYRETVSAILREFKSQDLVKLGYRRISIEDIEALKDIAGIWD